MLRKHCILVETINIAHLYPSDDIVKNMILSKFCNYGNHYTYFTDKESEHQRSQVSKQHLAIWIIWNYAVNSQIMN